MNSLKSNVCSVCLLLVVLILAPGDALAQLRVANWNVTNYSSGRVAAFQTSIYGEYQGRSLTPDILIGQEFLSTSGVTNFLNILNTAPGSPGDWDAAPFINGPDTDSAFFYRTSKVTFLDVTVVATGGVSPNHPRNIQRYDVQLVGYDSPQTVLACYSSHMKAGSDSSDQARRLLEAQRIRADAEALPEGWSFLLGGDFNIQSSSQAAYQEMVGSQADNSGRLFDPIKTPGSWNNNGAFRFVHSQDPSGAGGMDDRHDQILVSADLVDEQGFEYRGDASLTYSTSTWNDPNHSYRCWGNDGTSYNTTLRVSGNTMVGATIAQALKDTTSAGHLPVVLDLLVPPLIDADEILDFGPVVLGEPTEELLSVLNVGDTTLWGNEGIAALEYSLEVTAGFEAPEGTFQALAGDPDNQHEIVIDTYTTGPASGTLTIYSSDPEQPVRTVMLSAVVVPVICPGDLDGDASVTLSDLSQLLANYGRNDGVTYAGGDLDRDGDVDLSDLSALLAVYGSDCR